MADEMKRYIIHDTMEAYIKDLETEKAYFFGWTTEGNVARAISQEPIKAGIYNKTVAILQADDGMTFSVTTGVHYEEVMELQMNSDFKSVTDLTIQEIVESADGTFTATEKTVSGQVMDLKAKNFPKVYQVQLRSIAYDPDSGEEVADIYWIFDKAMPDGNLEEAFTAGANKTQTINFTALVPVGSDSYGKYVVVPRNQPDPLP